MLRLEDSVIYQDVISKGMEKGVEKGIKEGKSKLLIKQLKVKFKTLPKDYEQKILEAKDETIEKIAEDIFEIEKLSDLDRYFGK